MLPISKSASTAGFLITVYALGVAIGAPILTVALNRLDRKTALMLLLAFFIAGNALAGVAQTYGVLLIARVLAALCHGSFFGIGALVAAALVPKERSASAIAAMFVGLTLATVLGVPFGAFIGSKFGWHKTLAVVAIAAIGFFGFATVTPLQLLVIRASKAAPNLASSANISAFNIGNALGAALGGGVIAFGFGLSSLGAVAALVTVLGTAVAAIALKAI